jgi:hypothetical protein
VISLFPDNPNTGYAVSETDCTDVIYGLNTVSGFANSTNASRTNTISERLALKKSATVTAAANLVLGKGSVNVTTGSDPINLISNIGWTDGGIALIKFGAAVTVNHGENTNLTNVKIMLDGAIDMFAKTGDMLALRYDANGGGAGVPQWIEIYRTMANINAVRSVRMGTATTAAGTVDVADALITASSMVFLTQLDPALAANTHPFSVKDITAGVGFTILCDTAGTFDVQYLIIN